MSVIWYPLVIPKKMSPTYIHQNGNMAIYSRILVPFKNWNLKIRT